MRGFLVLDQLEQRIGKTEQRRRVDAFGRANRSCDERKVRAICERHAVEKEEAGHGKEGVRE